MINPITTVGGAAVKCPTKFEWGLEDISAVGAGRTEDMVMQKMRIGQARRVDLEWTQVSLADAAAILTAFNPEYVSVVCLDAMAGGYVTITFYTGDRKGVLFNSTTGVWESISFPIIQRAGAIV